MNGDWEEEDDELPTRVNTVDVKSVLRELRPHLLKMAEGPGAPAEFKLDDAQVVIGRGSDADIRIKSQDLSRKHVKLVRRGTEYRVDDLDSRNGMLLNGVKVLSATLRDQDVLQLGSVVLIYQEGT